ncbi:MAG: hypothetical protein SGPRY_002624 [Prymnesium sp.]
MVRIDGSPVCTSGVLDLVREAAMAVACVANEFDLHSLRIGGVTDLYHLFGGADAEHVIQKRGRWCSMVHQIFSRMSASEMMTVSARMLDADGVDLEAFRHGYVMPRRYVIGGHGCDGCGEDGADGVSASALLFVRCSFCLMIS